MDTVGDAYIVAFLIPANASLDADAFACAAVLRLASALLRAVAAVPPTAADGAVSHAPVCPVFTYGKHQE